MEGFSSRVSRNILTLTFACLLSYIPQTSAEPLPVLPSLPVLGAKPSPKPALGQSKPTAKPAKLKLKLTKAQKACAKKLAKKLHTTVNRLSKKQIKKCKKVTGGQNSSHPSDTNEVPINSSSSSSSATFIPPDEDENESSSSSSSSLAPNAIRLWIYDAEYDEFSRAFTNNATLAPYETICADPPTGTKTMTFHVAGFTQIISSLAPFCATQSLGSNYQELNLADGTYSFTVKAQDAAGAVISNGSYSFRVDAQYGAE